MRITKGDYERIVKMFEENKEEIITYYDHIENCGLFNKVNDRVGWDSLRAFLGDDFIIELRKKGLNDVYITDVCVKALKETVSDKIKLSHI